MDNRDEDKSYSLLLPVKIEVNEVVPRTNIRITVDMKEREKPLPLNKEYFTEIKVYYSDEKLDPSKGIIAHYSLKQLLERLNSVNSNNKKDSDPAILKGIFNGGTKGMFCDIPAPFLFLI